LDISLGDVLFLRLAAHGNSGFDHRDHQK
jgi:hypothetical protein